nr:EOG090X03I5 [Eulimnadia texana]
MVLNFQLCRGSSPNCVEKFTPKWLKILKAVSLYCDCAFDFAQFLVPAYHHDRCERSVQMRLYSMHKREFVLVFVALLASFGVFVFIGLAGPPITSTRHQAVSRLASHPNSSQMASGPFVLKTPFVSLYEQQLWVAAQIQTENKDDESFEKPFTVSVGVEALDENGTALINMTDAVNHNRTRHLECQRQACREILIFHLGYIEFSSYFLTVRFHGLESIHSRYTIKDIIFYFRSYSASFTRLEIWSRFTFLLVTFFVMCWFWHEMRKFSIAHWSLEQKWMSVLLPLLLLYNDPLFAWGILTGSWFPKLLDVVFQASFLCSLLLFWLCVYHGLRQNERRFLRFYLPKIAIVGSLWMSVIVVAVSQELQEIHDPSFSYQIDTSNFKGFKVFFFVAAAVYLAYLLLLMLKAYRELRNMPFFDMRLKFMTLLVLFVLCMSISVTTLRFGIDILQDNFISQVRNNYRNSTEFMALYALLNLYLYTMAYLYFSIEKTTIFMNFIIINHLIRVVNGSPSDQIAPTENSHKIGRAKLNLLIKFSI